MKDSKPPQFEAQEKAWTQEELNALHDMTRNYVKMEWLKKKVFMWGLWVLGLPATVLMVWEPLARLWKLFKGGS